MDEVKDMLDGSIGLNDNVYLNGNVINEFSEYSYSTSSSSGINIVSNLSDGVTCYVPYCNSSLTEFGTIQVVGGRDISNYGVLSGKYTTQVTATNAATETDAINVLKKQLYAHNGTYYCSSVSGVTKTRSYQGYPWTYTANGSFKQKCVTNRMLDTNITSRSKLNGALGNSGLLHQVAIYKVCGIGASNQTRIVARFPVPIFAIACAPTYGASWDIGVGSPIIPLEQGALSDDIDNGEMCSVSLYSQYAARLRLACTFDHKSVALIADKDSSNILPKANIPYVVYGFAKVG